MNQLVNMAAKMKYLSNGRLQCPFVVRAITGRSWGKGVNIVNLSILYLLTFLV